MLLPMWNKPRYSFAERASVHKNSQTAISVTPLFASYLLIVTLERDCITKRSNKIIRRNVKLKKTNVLLTSYLWSFSLVFFEKKIHISLSRLRSSASRVTTHGFVRINLAILHVSRCVTNKKHVYILLSQLLMHVVSQKTRTGRLESEERPSSQTSCESELGEIEANPARHRPRLGQS